MNKEETKEAIKVMQAYVDGETIEFASRGCNNDYWTGLATPFIPWNWSGCKFRIAKPKAVELEVGMELAISGHGDAFRKVVYIHGDNVCYTFENGLHTANMSRLCRGFNALINGKVYPILLKDSF